jgi:hypothetical protein
MPAAERHDTSHFSPKYPGRLPLPAAGGFTVGRGDVVVFHEPSGKGKGHVVEYAVVLEVGNEGAHCPPPRLNDTLRKDYGNRGIHESSITQLPGPGRKNYTCRIDSDSDSDGEGSDYEEMPHEELIKHTKKPPFHGDGSAPMFWVASVLKVGGAGLSSEGGTVREHDTELVLNMEDQWVISADRVMKVMIVLSPAQIARGETANMVGSTVMGVARSSMRGGKTRALTVSERELLLTPPPRGSVGLEIKTMLTALGGIINGHLSGTGDDSSEVGGSTTLLFSEQQFDLLQSSFLLHTEAKALSVGNKKLRSISAVGMSVKVNTSTTRAEICAKTNAQIAAMMAPFPKYTNVGVRNMNTSLSHAAITPGTALRVLHNGATAVKQKKGVTKVKGAALRLLFSTSPCMAPSLSVQTHARIHTLGLGESASQFCLG